jgi:hypothetical protein
MDEIIIVSVKKALFVSTYHLQKLLVSKRPVKLELQ